MKWSSKFFDRTVLNFRGYVSKAPNEFHLFIPFERLGFSFQILFYRSVWEIQFLILSTWISDWLNSFISFGSLARTKSEHGFIEAVRCSNSLPKQYSSGNQNWPLMTILYGKTCLFACFNCDTKNQIIFFPLRKMTKLARKIELCVWVRTEPFKRAVFNQTLRTTEPRLDHG